MENSPSKAHKAAIFKIVTLGTRPVHDTAEKWQRSVEGDVTRTFLEPEIALPLSSLISTMQKGKKDYLFSKTMITNIC